MAMSAEHSSVFAAFYLQWWRLHMTEKFASGTQTPKKKLNTCGINFSFPIHF